MPSELIATDGWRGREGAVFDWGLPGSWKAVIEREPPLRVENQRQGRTERRDIGGADGIMRCRS